MSTDFGATWSTITTGISNISSFKRIVLEVTPANHDVVYAGLLTEIPYTSVNGCPCGTPTGALCGNVGTSIYKFDYTMQIWTFKGLVPDCNNQSAIFNGLEVGRAQAFAVSPINENIIIAANVKAPYLSSDGGQNWTQVAYPGHDDAHHIAFMANGTDLWIAGDGGLYKSTNLGSSW